MISRLCNRKIGAKNPSAIDTDELESKLKHQAHANI